MIIIFYNSNKWDSKIVFREWHYIESETANLTSSKHCLDEVDFTQLMVCNMFVRNALYPCYLFYLTLPTISWGETFLCKT